MPRDQLSRQLPLTLEMKIAYLIIAHRYPEQVVRLVSRLNTPEVVFLIHLDKKADNDTYQVLLDAFMGQANVFFIKRCVCHWAGFGIIRACMQGMREALERGLKFDYLALLSGQDYPIKTNEYISQFLQERLGTSFIHHNPFPYAAWKDDDNGWDRIRYWHFIRSTARYSYSRRNLFTSRIGRRLLTPLLHVALRLFPHQRTFPAGWHPYGGAQFWCLHRQHVEYIDQVVRQRPALVRFFRFVYVPDEIFFQTLMGNSPYTGAIHNDTLTFVEWERPGATLYKSDMANLLASPYLFARKFDTTVDAEVLDLIDQQILALPTG